MDRKVIERLFIIAQVGLAVAGILFLCVAIFSDEKDNTSLCAALACIIISNLFQVIRVNQKKKKS